MNIYLTLKKNHSCFQLSLVLTTDEEIQTLNNQYRNKDAPTDILSFQSFDTSEEIIIEETNIINIGDLVVSCEFIWSASKEDGVTVQKEMAFIISHGVLHLLGYNHEEEQFLIQDAVTAQFS